MTDVVVTGLAASTRFGLGVAALRGGLEAADPCGPSPIDAPSWPEITTDIDPLLRATRTRHEPTIALLAAVEEGFGEAIRGWSDEARGRTGIVLANTSSGLAPYVHMYETGSTDGPRAVNPAEFPCTMLNYPATQLARAFALTGPNTTVSSGASAGWQAIEHAADRIRARDEPVCIAGGLEVRPPRAPVEDGTPPYTDAIGLLMLACADERRGETALARLAGWASIHGRPKDPAAAAIEAALARAGLVRRDVAVVVTDDAGSIPELEGADHRSLAPTVGRTLAAAAPLQCVVAVDALTRGSYDGGAALVVAVDGSGAAAAFVFTSP